MSSKHPIELSTDETLLVIKFIPPKFMIAQKRTYAQWVIYGQKSRDAVGLMMQVNDIRQDHFNYCVYVEPSELASYCGERGFEFKLCDAALRKEETRLARLLAQKGEPPTKKSRGSFRKRNDDDEAPTEYTRRVQV